MYFLRGSRFRITRNKSSFRDKYIVSLSSYDIVSKTDNAIRGGNQIFVDENRDSLK